MSEIIINYVQSSSVKNKTDRSKLYTTYIATPITKRYYDNRTQPNRRWHCFTLCNIETHRYTMDNTELNHTIRGGFVMFEIIHLMLNNTGQSNGQ